LIVFDLDGVITSEAAYWDAAGLTLHELMYSPRYWNLPGGKAEAARYQPPTSAAASRSLSRAIFPETEILALKARSINSNWDTTYAAVCLHLVDILAPLPATSLAALLPLRPWDERWIATFREFLGSPSLRGTVGAQFIAPPSAASSIVAASPPSAASPTPAASSAPQAIAAEGDDAAEVGAMNCAPTFRLLDALESSLLRSYTGMDLINRFDAYASARLAQPISGVFSRYSPFWEFCRDIFQEWFLGDELYECTYGHAPSQPGKPGCIHFEQPLLPLEQIRATLEKLRRQGYTLGIATGRDRQEALYPLRQYGLLVYFDERHISTYDDVERAEAVLREKGDRTLLTKPHPFPFLAAAMGTPVGAGEDAGGGGDACVARVQGIEESRGWAMESGEPARATQASPPHPASSRAPTDGPFIGIEDSRGWAMESGEPARATQASPPHPASSRAPTDGPFIVVGDSTSDIAGGRAAGAITVAVLSGAYTAEARARLAQSGPDFTIGDITALPALLEEIDDLVTIQRMQFTEKEKAERLLRRWFDRHMHLDVDDVTLTPKAVSLNSFNGFYRRGDEEFFFKTHVEEQGTIEEYYHAELLHQAGYNIVQPLRTLHEGGQQMVIYPVVRWPVMFDLVRAVEMGDVEKSVGVTAEMLVAAEREECARLLDIYGSTLHFSTAEEHARAPVHQLFWHRLAGERLRSFYEGKQIALPGGDACLPFNALRYYRWRINGVLQQATLGELLERAKTALHPARAGMTIIGHGDAHFGNVFLEEQRRYLYFDPAFAGRHSPLLDVVKPLFHNVFATWMYFPHDVARDLHLSLSIRKGSNSHPPQPCHPERSEGSMMGEGEILRCAQDDMVEGDGIIEGGDISGDGISKGGLIEIEHDFMLTPLRQAILRTKVEHLLRPLIRGLVARDALPADWDEIMRLALMCCPLLTINLADSERFPPEIGWLGLSLAVQVGNNGIVPWGFEL
jgi:phosphoglycolate phosphatase-like HAD superfamily hydrolase